MNGLRYLFIYSCYECIQNNSRESLTKNTKGTSVTGMSEDHSTFQVDNYIFTTITVYCPLITVRHSKKRQNFLNQVLKDLKQCTLYVTNKF